MLFASKVPWVGEGASWYYWRVTLPRGLYETPITENLESNDP